MSEYRRELTSSEVRYGFIRIRDRTLRDRIPRGEEIKLKIDGDVYPVSLDRWNRLGWFRRLFREHNLRPGDMILVSDVSSSMLQIKKAK